MMAKIFVGIYLTVLFSSPVKSGLFEAEKRLYQRMVVKNYDARQIRPRSGGGKDETVVRIELNLQNINGLDLSTQALSTSISLHLNWNDTRLKWNPSQFSNLTQIRIPYGEIWTPDIILVNRRDAAKSDSLLKKSMITASYTGGISWEPKLQPDSYCPVNIRWFPYDRQTCHLIFSSENYNGYEVKLALTDKRTSANFNDGEISLRNYHFNTEWNLLGTKAFITEIYFPCCEAPVLQAKFNITIERRSAFFKLTFITPATIVGLLMPFMFLLPPGSTTKITMGFGIMLTLVLLLGTLVPYLPPAFHAAPLLLKYYVILLAEVSVSLAISAALSVVAVRGPRRRKPATFVKKILVDRLGKVVCVSPRESSSTKKQQVHVDLQRDTKEGTKDENDDTNHDASSNDSTTGVDQYYQIALVLDRFLFVVSLIIIFVTIVTSAF